MKRTKKFERFPERKINIETKKDDITKSIIQNNEKEVIHKEKINPLKYFLDFILKIITLFVNLIISIFDSLQGLLLSIFLSVIVTTLVILMINYEIKPTDIVETLSKLISNFL